MEKLKEIKSNINLLKSIKTSYILDFVFSFISVKQKLNLIINNKKLQKMLDIDIEEYKKISGRYLIGQKNGKGREYIINTHKLIFEGEYENWRKNGKGREYYDNHNLLFEGEYLNGKKWNGKGYNKYGVIDFVIKDGNGKIKEYYHNDCDKLKFER